jgi:hypothetical protein
LLWNTEGPVLLTKGIQQDESSFVPSRNLSAISKESLVAIVPLLPHTMQSSSFDLAALAAQTSMTKKSLPVLHSPGKLCLPNL